MAVIILKGDDSAPALLLWLTALEVNDLNKQHRWANASVLGAFQRTQLTHITFAFTNIIIKKIKKKSLRSFEILADSHAIS